MNQKRLNNNISEKQGIHKLEKVERETLYLFNEEEGVWIADSTIPRDIHKLEKQGWTCTKTQCYADGTVMSKTFTAPRNCLSPRAYNPNKPKRSGRILTDEQKQKMQEARKSKNNVN